MTLHVESAGGGKRAFKANFLCPVCGGHDGLIRGKGVRCSGYLSSCGQYVHCSREEFAGSLPFEPGSRTYAHWLAGACKCGTTHGPGGSGFERDEIVARYAYRDESELLLFEVAKTVKSNGKKSFFQRRPKPGGGWQPGRGGVRVVPYRLPELHASPVDQLILIPEGEKDVDNLVKVGFVATTNPGGAGRWLSIFAEHFRGRTVVVLSDNDAVGHAHASQVAANLSPVAASVKVLDLPGLHEKGDVSDWLAAGGTAERLLELIAAAPAWRAPATPTTPPPAATAVGPDPLARLTDRIGSNTEEAFADDIKMAAARLVRTSKQFQRVRIEVKGCGVNMKEWDAAIQETRRQLRAAESPVADAAGPYVVVDHAILWSRRTPEGESLVELANFVARIDEDIERNDGVEVTRQYALSGVHRRGFDLRPIRVAAAEFGGLSWVAREWGALPIISPGQGHKDRLREAIQRLSNPTSKTLFCHTGWSDVDGERAFLHAGGAIGADVAVELDHELWRFRLPEQVTDAAAAVRVSLDLLDLAPLSISAPLLGATYLAPLSSLIDPDLGVWLFGPSGSFKSEFCALCQAHFGDFTRKNLPANWTSTANSLEIILFLLKDVLCVVDDYAPQPSQREQSELDRAVARVVRNVGNRAGRGRSTADQKLRSGKPPRGMVIFTGEDLPRGQSLDSRIVTPRVEKGAIDRVKLTRHQRERHRLSHAMRAYIEWLAPQMDKVREQVADGGERLQAAREIFFGAGDHNRQPEALSLLYLGLDYFFRFAQSLGVLDEDAADKRLEEIAGALRSVGRDQGDRQKALHPAEQFVATIRDLFDQGKVDLAAKGQSLVQGRRANPVGWQDAEFAYLLTTAALTAVAEAKRELGEPWTHTRHVILSDLVERGIVFPGEGSHREQNVRVVNAEGPKRVLVLPLSLIVEHDSTTAATPSSEDS